MVLIRFLLGLLVESSVFILISRLATPDQHFRRFKNGNIIVKEIKSDHKRFFTKRDPESVIKDDWKSPKTV